MFAARGRPLRATVVGCALLLLVGACRRLGRRLRRQSALDADVRLTRVHRCTRAARYDHVVVVVMENKSWSGVLEGQGQWLTARKNECFTATNFVQSASPSRPNYIALVAGATYGCEGSNADPPGGCTPRSPSLFKQVIDAGGSAKNCGVDIGDKYLDTLLSPILASSTYRTGKTAVIVVYDEYTPLPNVLMSESVHPGSTTADASDNLLFHTFESMLGVPLRAGAGDLRAASGL